MKTISKDSFVTDEPYFSVIIPFKNAEQTIGITLASAISQTFKDIEIILVNDGSEDSSQDIVDSMSDPRFRVIKNNKSEGPASARNKGINVAKGQILSFLDADDFWSPQYLEKVFSVFVSNPFVDVVYAFFIKNDNSKLSGSSIYSEVLRQGWLCAPSVLSVKSRFLCENNLFWNSSYVHSEDDVFCFELSKKAYIFALADPLVFYGAGPGNISSSTKDRACGFLRLYNDYKDDIIKICGSLTFAKHMFTVARYFAASGLFAKANDTFLRSLIRYYIFGKSKSGGDSARPLCAYISMCQAYLFWLYKTLGGRVK